MPQGIGCLSSLLSALLSAFCLRTNTAELAESRRQAQALASRIEAFITNLAPTVGPGEQVVFWNILEQIDGYILWLDLVPPTLDKQRVSQQTMRELEELVSSIGRHAANDASTTQARLKRRSGRPLIVCLDGTGNRAAAYVCYDTLLRCVVIDHRMQTTNVARLYSMLMKGYTTDQVVYYQVRRVTSQLLS